MKKKNKRIILIVLLIIAVAVIWVKASANNVTVTFSVVDVQSENENDYIIRISTPGLTAGNVEYDSGLFDFVRGDNGGEATLNNSGTISVYFNENIDLLFRAKANAEGQGSFSFANDGNFYVDTNEGIKSYSECTQGSCTVTINGSQTDPDPESVEPIIDSPTLSLKVDEAATLNITNGVAVTWSSLDPSIATVDPERGVVVAISEGVTTVVATTKLEPTQVSRATVYVTKVPEAGAPTVSPAGLIELGIGGKKQMSSDTNGAVWSSDNGNIVQVDQTGKITGIAEGQAKVIVTNPENGKSCEFFVSVSNQYAGNDEENQDAIEDDNVQSNDDSAYTNNSDNSNSQNANTKTNKVVAKGSENSTSQNSVPATGESTVEMIVVFGIITLVIATIVFRKKAK